MSSLENSLSVWECIEYAASAVVLLGVVGEYCASFTKIPKSDTERIRLEKGSTLLLIFGLSIELLSLVKTSQLSGQMIARLNFESADARKEAARLGKVAEDERLARVKLEQQEANRDITAEEFSELSSRLSRFAGQRAVIDVFPVTFEHVAIAGEILGVLVNARWNVSGFTELPAPPRVRLSSNGTGFPAPLLVQGIHIQSTSDERSRAAAAAFFDALKSTTAQGNLFGNAPLPDPEDPRVWIYVGDKPTPLRSWVK